MLSFPRRAISINILKKVGLVWKYDFHTLKLANSWIFWKWVKPLREGLEVFLLVGKLSSCCCFDVWKWFESFGFDFEARSSVFQTFTVRFWSILGREDGSEAPGRVPVNICWLENSLICFSLMFGRVLSWLLIIWDNFFLVKFYFLCVCMAILRFGCGNT